MIRLILIDYYRKTEKSNSVWMSLVEGGYEFAISVITKYEIYSGAKENQLEFWNAALQAVEVIQLDEVCVNTAFAINTKLKFKRKQIDLADLFIAATAVTHNLALATLNKKHFDRIGELAIL